MAPYTLSLNQLVSGIAIATSQYQLGRPAVDIVAGLHPFLPAPEAELDLAPAVEPLRLLASAPDIQPHAMAGAFHEAAQQLARLTQESHPPVSLWAEDIRKIWMKSESSADPALRDQIEEAALIESLRRFIEFSPEPMGVVKCDPDGSAYMVLFNKRNRELWSLSEEDVSGLNVSRFFYPEDPGHPQYKEEYANDQQMVRDFIRECLRTNSSARSGFRMLRSSGVHLLVDMYVGLVPGTNYAYFQVINETQREQALEDIRIREAVLRNAEKPLLMLSFDERSNPSGMLTSAGFDKLLGYEPGEIGTKPVIDFIPKHARTAFAARLRQFLASGSLRWEAASLVRKDGSSVLVDIEANDSGVRGTRFAIASFSDANARIAAEKDAAEAQKVEIIASVSARIAHDANNMLTILMGGLDLLLGKFPEDEILRVMMEKTTMLNGMFNRFRQVTSTVEREGGINIHSVLSETDIHWLPTGRDVEVQFHLAKAPWTVAGPTFDVWQIISNIFKNAVEEMEKTAVKKLAVRTENVEILEEASLRRLDPANRFPDARPGQFLKLSIEDTAGGIPPEVLPHIFEKNFSTKIDSDAPRGQGLYGSYRAIAQRGGLMAIDTVFGQGTTVHIYLPRTEARTPPPPSNTSSDVLPDERWVSPGGESVLIADDDEGVRNLFQRILRFYRYSDVVTAGTSDEVLEIARNRPDLSAIIMDWRMPGMTGDELLGELYALNSALPILVNTGLIPEHRPAYPNVQFAQKLTGAPRVGRALRLLIEGKRIK